MSTPVSEEAGAAEIAIVERLQHFLEVASGSAAQSASSARQHIAALADPESFLELGTLATFDRSVASEGPHRYGGGIIGGEATIDGRRVMLAVDDDNPPSELDADSAPPPPARSTGKAARLYRMAAIRRTPYIEVARGDAGPEISSDRNKTGTDAARGFIAEPAFPYLLERNREVPVVSAVLGDAFGSASFSAGLCDFLVQMEGTELGLVRPPAEETTTEPAAAAVRKVPAGNGEADVYAKTPEEAYAAIRTFLSYLPSYAGGPLPIVEGDYSTDYDDKIATLVPARRSRAYEVKNVIRRICDPGSFFELKPTFARNIVTAFGRLGGIPVGFVANAPLHSAGGLTPDCCLKATSFVALCDSFGIPMVLLQDTPGFLVSASAERDRAVTRVMMLYQALSLATVPVVSVVLRKAFGLAFVVMAGDRDIDLLLAWPGAEIGFMDPPVAVNVLFEPQVHALPEEERPAFVAAKIKELSVDFEPYGVATMMTVDEIVEPGLTRSRLVEHFRTVVGDGRRPHVQGPLASWPRWF